MVVFQARYFYYLINIEKCNIQSIVPGRIVTHIEPQAHFDPLLHKLSHPVPSEVSANLQSCKTLNKISTIGHEKSDCTTCHVLPHLAVSRHEKSITLKKRGNNSQRACKSVTANHQKHLVTKYTLKYKTLTCYSSFVDDEVSVDQHQLLHR